MKNIAVWILESKYLSPYTPSAFLTAMVCYRNLIFRSEAPLWTCLCYTHSLTHPANYPFTHSLSHGCNYFSILAYSSNSPQISSSYIKEFLLCYIEDFLFFILCSYFCLFISSFAYLFASLLVIASLLWTVCFFLQKGSPWSM